MGLPPSRSPSTTETDVVPRSLRDGHRRGETQCRGSYRRGPMTYGDTDHWWYDSGEDLGTSCVSVRDLTLSTFHINEMETHYSNGKTLLLGCLPATDRKQGCKFP